MLSLFTSATTYRFNHSGGSRIFSKWGRQPSGGWQHTYDFTKFTPKTVWNWKNLDPQGRGARPEFDYVDPPLNSYWCFRNTLGLGSVCVWVWVWTAERQFSNKTVTELPFVRYRQSWSNGRMAIWRQNSYQIAIQPFVQIWWMVIPRQFCCRIAIRPFRLKPKNALILIPIINQSINNTNGSER